jgi:hypothetical protein
MAEYDGRGRLRRIDNSKRWHTGHSVCNECWKDMPRVWDTVCFMCDRTFCYAHSISFKGVWLCKKCKSKLVAELL